MPSTWRKEFDAEVSGENFVIGPKVKPLILTGPGAEDMLGLWQQCLNIGKFLTYRTSPYEIEKRANGKAVPFDEADDKTRYGFENADTYFIVDFFAPVSDNTKEAMRWFLRRVIDDGKTVVVATDDDTKSVDDYYDNELYDFFEQEFEVIHNGKTPKARKTIKRGTKPHSNE